MAAARLYVAGYSGATKTREQLARWKHVTEMDPEFRERVLGCLDASIDEGSPLGIGSTVREDAGTLDLAMSRHHPAAPGERACCTWQGVRYALDHGEAHAAFPGRSYHQRMVPTVGPDGKCLAIDWVGNLRWLKANCHRFGLNEFSNVGNEPWHSQPVELPRGRASFRTSMWPLKPWPLPARPTTPAPTRVDAPKPTIAKGRGVRSAVRELQALCNFWGWRDAMGRTLIVDGLPGAKTVQAIRTMQRALGLDVDGIYGRVSAKALQGFLDLMATKAAA